ncbi:hypothetical protein HDU67_003607 [Dinochytrium kinnereticum]|nr:hypothetical protein HDU67_003607 [Dinochytrium kinnereticum]
MKSDTSKSMYTTFLSRMKSSYTPDKIKDGVFGAMMQVNIVNDGPVTIVVESPKSEVAGGGGKVGKKTKKGGGGEGGGVVGVDE